MEEKLYGKLNPGMVDSKVDQQYDPDSPRAQSGTAVKEAIETVPELYIDQEFNGESEKAQSGIAVQQAITPIIIESTIGDSGFPLLTNGDLKTIFRGYYDNNKQVLIKIPGDDEHNEYAFTINNVYYDSTEDKYSVLLFSPVSETNVIYDSTITDENNLWAVEGAPDQSGMEPYGVGDFSGEGGWNNNYIYGQTVTGQPAYRISPYGWRGYSLAAIAKQRAGRMDNTGGVYYNYEGTAGFIVQFTDDYSHGVSRQIQLESGKSYNLSFWFKGIAKGFDIKALNQIEDTHQSGGSSIITSINYDITTGGKPFSDVAGNTWEKIEVLFTMPQNKSVANVILSEVGNTELATAGFDVFSLNLLPSSTKNKLTTYNTSSQDESDNAIQSEVVLYSTDQNFRPTSAAPQSGTAVAQAIASVPSVIVDQTYDNTSTHAQSGTAVKGAIETVPELFIDQTFDGESEKAQSGVAIKSQLDTKANINQSSANEGKYWKVDSNGDLIFDYTSSEINRNLTITEKGRIVPRLTNNDLRVIYNNFYNDGYSSSTPDKKFIYINSNNEEYSYCINFVRYEDDGETSEGVEYPIFRVGLTGADFTIDYLTSGSYNNAQATRSIHIIYPVDQTYNSESENPQSGTAVNSAIETAKTEIDGEIALKADQSEVDTLGSDLSNLTTEVGTKANQSDLDTLESEIETKASQTALESLSEAVSTKADKNQDIENAGKYWKVNSDGNLTFGEPVVILSVGYTTINNKIIPNLSINDIRNINTYSSNKQCVIIKDSTRLNYYTILVSQENSVVLVSRDATYLVYYTINNNNDAVNITLRQIDDYIEIGCGERLIPSLNIYVPALSNQNLVEITNAFNNKKSVWIKINNKEVFYNILYAMHDNSNDSYTVGIKLYGTSNLGYDRFVRYSTGETTPGVVVTKVDQTFNGASINAQSGIAIQEKLNIIDADIALKQNIIDNTLETTSKQIPTAINEVFNIANGNRPIQKDSAPTTSTKADYIGQEIITSNGDVYKCISISTINLWSQGDFENFNTGSSSPNPHYVYDSAIQGNQGWRSKGMQMGVNGARVSKVTDEYYTGNASLAIQCWYDNRAVSRQIELVANTKYYFSFYYKGTLPGGVKIIPRQTIQDGDNGNTGIASTDFWDGTNIATFNIDTTQTVNDWTKVEGTFTLPANYPVANFILSYGRDDNKSGYIDDVVLNKFETYVYEWKQLSFVS